VTAPDAAAPLPLSAPTGRPGDPGWYTRGIELGLYVLAGISYIWLGMFHKWLLNWILGPVWLVTWIWAVPALVERLRRRRTGVTAA
jgi:hypothetical protein